MKTKHILIIGLTASSLAISTSQALAGSFLIDNFDVPSFSSPASLAPSTIGGFPPSNSGTNPITVSVPGQIGTNTFTGLDSNQVIGGSRNVKFTQTSSLAPGLQSSAGVFTGSGNYDGFFDIVNNSKTNSIAELSWNDIGVMGQGNFNVLSGANDKKGIQVDFFTDGVPFKYTLIVSDGMNMSSVTKDFDFMGVDTQSQATFSFDEILANGPVDLNTVNYVKLVVEGNLGHDLTITQIGSFEVPEPSAILGLLAILGTGAFSLKRKTKEK